MDNKEEVKKSKVKRWVWIFITCILILLLKQCYSFFSIDTSVSKAEKSLQQRLRKEAYQRMLVKVQNEEYTNERGEKFKRITYSKGSVTIPIEYLSIQRETADLVVQFMAFFMPSKKGLKVPENQRHIDDKKISFFFLFDVRNGSWNNMENAYDFVKKLIDKGEMVKIKETEPGVSFYKDPRKYGVGGVFIIDSDIVTDPMGRPVAYACSKLTDSCFFNWVFNEALFLRVEFKDSEIENKVEMIKTLSALVKTFIQE